MYSSYGSPPRVRSFSAASSDFAQPVRLKVAERERRVLYHVVEGSDHARPRRYGKRDPQHVEQVRLALLVLLPCVGTSGDLDRTLKGHQDCPFDIEIEEPPFPAGTPSGGSIQGSTRRP